MDKKSVKKIDELDSELRDLFESLKDYSDLQLNRRPANGKWSILQNMHHLILSEGYALKYLKKKLGFNPTLKNANLITFFRSGLLGIYMGAGIKREAPKAVDTDELPNDTKFWETIKLWKGQRKELRTFLQDLTPEFYKKEFYKHPFVGKLTIFQMLKFFQQHFRRHQKAIERISRDLPKQID